MQGWIEAGRTCCPWVLGHMYMAQWLKMWGGSLFSRDVITYRRHNLFSCQVCVYHGVVLLSLLLLWGCRGFLLNRCSDLTEFDFCSASCASLFISVLRASWKAGVSQTSLHRALTVSSPMHCPCLWNVKTNINSDRNFSE